MKLAIVNITSGGMSGGYKTYLEAILPRLAGYPGMSLLVALPQTVAVSSWQKKFPKIIWVLFEPKPYRLEGLDSKSKKAIAAFAPDIVFIPTARFCKIAQVPTVTMVRNTEPLIIHDNPFLTKIINWFRAQEAHRASQQADRVIAVSQFVKQLMVKRWKIAGDKIGLVYHGVESPEKDIVKPAVLPDVWQNNFFFTAGSIRPARGLEDVISAWRELSKNTRNSYNLLIAGDVNHQMRGYYSKLQQLVRNAGLEKNIIFAGSLKRNEMSWCYCHCRLFLMTTRAEACPNIALEAMMHGCLTVAADNPPLPEFFLDSAFFYPPAQPQIFAKQIEKILNLPPEEKAKLKTKALARAAQFSWDQCAVATMQELKTVFLSQLS